MNKPIIKSGKRAAGELSSGVSRNFILHLHPRLVPEQTLKFTLTFGLGGMSLVLVTLLMMTGILLKFVYEPSPDRAYDSILILQRDVLFGQFIRNIHHWSGNILVALVLMHLMRVFFTGAFHRPRQLNWVIGLCLFFFVLFSNFTGYLLPWDQLAYWAVTICTGMFEYIPGLGLGLQKMIRGGPEVGATTLSIFFTLHTAILPFCFILFLVFHFWRVRKAGGVVMPREAPGEEPPKPIRVPSIPNLVLREATVGLVLIAFIFTLSLFFDAPLTGRANPGMSPNPTKAPWFFVGIQEMLLHLHPIMAAFVIPMLVAGALCLLPYLRYDRDPGGVWFVSQKGRRMGVVSAIAAVLITVAGIIGDEYFLDFSGWMPGVPDAISNGLIPAFIMLGLLIGFYIIMRKRYTATNNETIQTLFVFMLVVFIIFTVTGVWFRGEGMALIWPWG